MTTAAETTDPQLAMTLARAIAAEQALLQVTQTAQKLADELAAERRKVGELRKANAKRRWWWSRNDEGEVSP